MASAATVQIVAQLVDKATGPLQKISQGFTRSLGSMATAAAGIGAAFVAAAGRLAVLDSRLKDLSDATGSTVEDLSRLEFAFEQTGIAGNELKTILAALASKQSDALRNGGEAALAFQRLGIGVEELASTDPARLLQRVADGMQTLGTAQRRAAGAQGIFGDQFQKLIPLLDEGGAKLKDLVNEADRLGITLTGEQAARAKEFQQEWNKFTAAATGAFRTISNELLPPLASVLRFVSSKIAIFANDIRLAFQEVQDFIDRLFVRAQTFRKQGVSLESFGFGEQAATITDRLQGVAREIDSVRDRYRDLISQMEVGNQVVRNEIAPEVEGLERRFNDLTAQYSVFARRVSRISGVDLARNFGQLAQETKKVETNAEGALTAWQKFFAGLKTGFGTVGDELANLSKKGEEFARSIATAVENNLVAAIDRLVDGVDSLADAFKNLIDAFIRDLARLATQQLVQRLLSYAFPAGGNTQGGAGTAGTSGASGQSVGGRNRLIGGGGGTTIVLQSSSTREDQQRRVRAIVLHELANRRTVRVAAGVI